MPALLDLNDCNVQLWHGDSHVQSPGYALLRGREYVFGAAARDAARLRPRDVNTRFWWQLGTDPLQPPLGPARHTADLVHAHLQSLHTEAGQPAEIIVAVPGTMAREQLSLFLGIVQQCPFDAVGLVNRSVALGSLYGGRRRLFHLELQLHQAVVAQLALRGDTVSLQHTAPLPGCGLLQLQERLVEVIANAFVRQTRFDPRRKADTEQQLYNALPQALRALQSAGEANLEVSHYRARIAREDLAAAAQRLFDGIRNTMRDAGGIDTLIAEPAAALLPGLDTAFPSLQLVEEHAVREALAAHGDALVQRGQALSFVTALPQLAVRETAEPARAKVEPGRAAADESDPTHLLQDARARRLSADGTTLREGWEIVRGEDGWQLRGDGPAITINGAAYAPGQRLRAGDEIGLGAERFALLIEVED
ncbi:MAG: hypothetical protein U5K56_08885 [Halioglobus sp.]|nr:hypothetical protein [Halioglobus sp.]